MSLLLSGLEIATVYGSVLIPRTSGHQAIAKVIISVWLLGGVCSFGVAVLAVFIDTDRMIAFIAMSAAVAAFVFCGLPMRV